MKRNNLCLILVLTSLNLPSKLNEKYHTAKYAYKIPTYKDQ